jgi:putative transcriptional regulator
MNVKDIRQKLKVSQEGFTSPFGLTLHQIKNWEQGRSQPHGALRTHLDLIGRDLEGVRQRLATA